jgi:uncharacterized delta-60 repeat protein
MLKINFVSVLFVFSICVSFSQSGTNDATFNVINTCPNLGGFNDKVNSIVVQPDGKILVGGLFTTYKGVSVGRIARLNPDGTLDAAFPAPSSAFNNNVVSFNLDVNSISLQPDGKIIVAGRFNDAFPLPKNGIMRLNSDGSYDPSFNIGSSFNSLAIILGTKIQSDGKILVFGNQTSFNGNVTSKITRLNTDGSLDPSFSTAFNVSIPVLCMAIQADGKILVGGDFTQCNGVGRNKIARLNSNGTLDPTFNPGTGFNSTVNSISIQQDGKIITGGVFTAYNGSTCNYIARINTDGTFDSSFNTGSGFNALVYSIEIQMDGKVIVGGGFTFFNSVARSRIARINSNGALDINYDPGTGHNNNVRTTAIQSNGKIISGGDFSTYDDMERVRIAIANPDGTRDTLFNPIIGFDNNVNCTARQADGKIIVGGGFTLFNDFSAKRIVRINSNGSIDLTFTSGLGFNGIVYSSAIQSDGKIILGGDFTSYNGIAINRIVRLNSNGALDPTFNPGIGFNGIVYSVVIQIDGKIIAGGVFTSINGNTANRIARLNTDGSLDPTFNSGTGFNSEVRALEIQQNGKIIAGGDFAFFNGVNRVRIARINTNGTLDATFTANLGLLPATVRAIKVQTDNQIIVGGSFSVLVNGNSVSNIARLNTDGSIDPTFYPGSGLSGGNGQSLIGVHCIDIQSQTNGKLIVGGSFATCNGISRNNIVSLTSNGTIDASFNQGSGFDNLVRSVAVEPTGKIIVGGDFNNYNGVCRNNIARLNGACVNSFGTDNVIACGSYTWIDGINYTSNNNTATFIQQNYTGCDSTVSLNLTINNTSTPIGSSSQIFCNSATVNDLVVSGSAIQWYANSTGGLPLLSSIILVNGATYYASQTISGCESPSRLPITVTINTPAPTGASTQTFCNSATVNDIVASGSTIQWYASQSGGSPLAPPTNLLNGNTYYASQTIAGCESTARLSVIVTINAPTAPLGSTSQIFCNSATVNDIVASGSTIQWYASQSGGSPLAPPTNLLNGNTYYASQTIAGCESTARLSVSVAVNAPSAPLGSSTQTFCNSATVNDLVASGSTIQWYASQSGGSPLAPTTNLLNSNTYYASQTISSCESVSLLAVNVFINSVSDITTSLTGITISSNNTLASYVWLDCGNNFSILSGETSQNFTPTVNGSYSVQLTENSCVDTSLCVTISSVSLFENTFMDNLKVYPNPNSGNFTVDIGHVIDKVDVTVLDLQGRIVLQKMFTQTQLFQMNIYDSAGIYIVSISSEHAKSLVRILKE